MSAFERARAAWPGVEVPEGDFLAYLHERALDPEGLEPRRLQELYLACACARGGREALAAFRERYVAPLRESLGRSWPPAQVDDVLQQVQIHLLVAAPGGQPRIRQYRGGALQSFVKVMALRELRRRAEPIAPERAVEIEPAALCDPEHRLLLERHRPEIQATLRERVQALPAEDRLILMLSVVDGVSTVKLAQHLGVNQSTAWRRLERIKADLAEAIHAHLKERLNVSSGDLSSLVNALRSSLELSVSQIFGKKKKDGEDA